MLDNFRTYDPKNTYTSILSKDFDKHKSFAIGAPAPNFRLVNAQGDTVSLHDFAGRLVYVNFWKTTNGLCLRDLAYAPGPDSALRGQEHYLCQCCAG